MKDLYSFLRGKFTKTTLGVADRAQSADCSAVNSAFIFGSMVNVVGQGRERGISEKPVSLLRVFKVYGTGSQISSDQSTGLLIFLLHL